MKNSVEDLALVQNQDRMKPTQVKSLRFTFLRFCLLKINVDYVLTVRAHLSLLENLIDQSNVFFMSQIVRYPFIVNWIKIDKNSID